MKWRLHSFLWTVFVVSGLVLGLFTVLRWMAVPAGDLLDWVIGLLSGWWLLVVLTVPWNIHFQAREVLDSLRNHHADAPDGLPANVAYARRWRNRSLAGAIALHVLSAAGLYWLAASGISPIGYVAALAALLLTLLRPTLRGYEYVRMRLGAIAHDARYPQENVYELTSTVHELKRRLETIEISLDVDKPDSWASQQTAQFNELHTTLARTRSELADLRAQSLSQHGQLIRDTERAVAQISADSQFLNHVREILRFVKEA